MKPVREITAEQENFRLEIHPNSGFSVIKRDAIEPVPVGTHVAMVFKVTGYDKDCDGSLMARLEQVDVNGDATGWRPTNLGLYPQTAVVLDGPTEILKVNTNA